MGETACEGDEIWEVDQGRIEGDRDHGIAEGCCQTLEDLSSAERIELNRKVQDESPQSGKLAPHVRKVVEPSGIFREVVAFWVSGGQRETVHPPTETGFTLEES